jgi:hypothetical protein
MGKGDANTVPRKRLDQRALGNPNRADARCSADRSAYEERAAMLATRRHCRAAPIGWGLENPCGGGDLGDKRPDCRPNFTGASGHGLMM